MTKQALTQKNYVPGTSRGPRSVRTLLLQMAADKERQEEIGARLKELRGRKPQPVVADAVNVTLRAYQAWEAGDSGIAWDNLVKLAGYFGVSADYIEYGETGREGPSTQLDRIEAMLVEVLERLGDGAIEELVSAAIRDDTEASAGRAGVRSGAGSGGKRAAPGKSRARGTRTA